VDPFEEEEEGTSVNSDVVKVKGEDPATPGPLKRNDTGTVTMSQYRYNKTKQHTPAHFRSDSKFSWIFQQSMSKDKYACVVLWVK